MKEVIKVEHEDDLTTAEAPAFAVIGVAHGHRRGRRITTYSLITNQELTTLLTNPSVRTERQAAEIQMTILYLLMGASEPGSYRTLTWVPGFADVWFAVNER